MVGNSPSRELLPRILDTRERVMIQNGLNSGGFELAQTSSLWRELLVLRARTISYSTYELLDAPTRIEFGRSVDQRFD